MRAVVKTSVILQGTFQFSAYYSAVSGQEVDCVGVHSDRKNGKKSNSTFYTSRAWCRTLTAGIISRRLGIVAARDRNRDINNAILQLRRQHTKMDSVRNHFPLDLLFSCKVKTKLQNGDQSGPETQWKFAVASDETKLPLFTVFNRPSNARIGKKLQDIFPGNSYGCRQRKSQIDARSLKIWTRCIQKHYKSGYGKFVLVLDDLSCHKQTPFLDYLKSFGTDVEIIPGGYSCDLQFYDVGAM